MNRLFTALLRWLRPHKASSRPALDTDETLGNFIWRTTSAHQFYVGLFAVAIAFLNSVPIALQKWIVDGPMTSARRSVSAEIKPPRALSACRPIRLSRKFAGEKRCFAAIDMTHHFRKRDTKNGLPRRAAQNGAVAAESETQRLSHTREHGGTRGISSGRPKIVRERQDSNLGMAESKSDQFAFVINAHSEK